VTGFWDTYDALMARIKGDRPATAADLFAILGKPEASAGEAFAVESGSLMAALDCAGWDVYGIERDYLWEARAPGGEWIHYVEGDLYRGRHRPPGCTDPRD
jgi:hypothetical protein